MSWNQFNHEIKIVKTHPDAIFEKFHRRDVGIDVALTRLVEVKFFGNDRIKLYGTGIKVKPPDGCYFELLPRSSMFKKGLLLANSVGIIDPGYRGEIMAPIWRINDEVSWPELPCRCLQLILKPLVLANCIEVDKLDETERNEGGFGSTG